MPRVSASRLLCPLSAAVIVLTAVLLTAVLLTAVLLTTVLLTTGLAAPVALAAPRGPVAPAGTGPDLAKGVAYLASPRNLIDGHYYQSLPRTADFGLTIDGALALAATGDNTRALKKILAFIASAGKDPSGKSVNYWTGVGTKFASGGSIAKEALLAEVVAANPRDFGGHDLIGALDATICRRAPASHTGACPYVGAFRNSASVFDQALGIIALVRAGQLRKALRPIGYLESLQSPEDGSFPSLIPSNFDSDVDSTAMAAMALKLVPGHITQADASSGLAWIARQQASSGGFQGVGAISINSTGLAIQALSLERAKYGRAIGAARAFLGREQNADGGFNPDSGRRTGSDLRASAQALSGDTGISFGVLTRDLNLPSAPRRPAGGGSGWIWVIAGVIAAGVLASGAWLVLRRRKAAQHQSRKQSAPDVPDRVGS